ncbi:hypothetical protein [Celeribacter sp. ULVN23_4]
MIKLMKTAGGAVKAKDAILFDWDVLVLEIAWRPANHNLTRAARHSNVILLGGGRTDPDYRPDLGARMPLAA